MQTLETEAVTERQWSQQFLDQAQGKETDATYTQVKVTCKHCGLHFMIATWYPERHSAKTIYCPECGMRGKKFVWAEAVKGFVYQTIPGNAELVDYKTTPTVGISFVQGKHRYMVLK